VQYLAVLEGDSSLTLTAEDNGKHIVGTSLTQNVVVNLPPIADVVDGWSVEVTAGSLPRLASMYIGLMGFSLGDRIAAAGPRGLRELPPLMIYLTALDMGSSIRLTAVSPVVATWTFDTAVEMEASGPYLESDEDSYAFCVDTQAFYMLKTFYPVEFDMENFVPRCFVMSNGSGCWTGIDLHAAELIYQFDGRIYDEYVNLADGALVVTDALGNLVAAGTVADLTDQITADVQAALTIPVASIIDRAGDGADGDVILSDLTTLTRDMYYRNLDMNGQILIPNGFSVYVQESLLAFGMFVAAGSPGTSASGATPGVAGAGAVGAGDVFTAGGDGTNGAAPVSDSNGAAPTAPAEFYGNGGAGGCNWGEAIPYAYRGTDSAGGVGDTTTGGIVPATTGVTGKAYHRPLLIEFMPTSPKVGGGQGGCGGGAGGSDPTNHTLGGAGGGGGGGGGVINVVAKTIILPPMDIPVF